MAADPARRVLQARPGGRLSVDRLTRAVRTAENEATVKTHLLRTFTKLDVGDRTAAVTTAMSLGLLP